MFTKIITIKTFKKCQQIMMTYSQKKKAKTTKNNKEESKRCSKSRACSKIKDYILSNNFDYFFTLTLKNEVRFDIIKATEYINSSIKSYSKIAKRKGFDFKFCYVFELTKKGGIHLHGFFSGFYDLYVNKYGHLSSLYFDNLGFQNFINANQVNAFYLIKYILKDEIPDLKRIYHHSKNLELPLIDKFHDNFNEFDNFVFTFQNGCCKIATIRK